MAACVSCLKVSQLSPNPGLIFITYLKTDRVRLSTFKERSLRTPSIPWFKHEQPFTHNSLGDKMFWELVQVKEAAERK